MADSSSDSTACDVRMAYAICAYFDSMYREELLDRGFMVQIEESSVYGEGLSLWLTRQEDGLMPTLPPFPELFLVARIERKCMHFTPELVPATEMHFVYASLRASQQAELACLEGSRGNGHDVLVVELLPSHDADFSFSIPLMARVLPLLDADEEQLHSCAKYVATALGHSFLQVYAS